MSPVDPRACPASPNNHPRASLGIPWGAYTDRVEEERLSRGDCAIFAGNPSLAAKVEARASPCWKAAAGSAEEAGRDVSTGYGDALK